ncbi:MAG: superoxide dismutase [Phenylobacterium sp.]|uniref:superoxide dismutase n=1 Tax=Phenylobacterium sp. TaxID=1871053 RepID=UPI001A5444F2|nr:superoxide dismutase [Phenylobacterium sp.]MBL8556191.1 superoxide dismutase [Phenylobacterium sp.]
MIVLPALPYAYDALQPVVSETTMRTHHDKHHARYVEVTNQMLADTPGEQGPLEQVVTRAWHRGARKLFNNAAQALNHGFFWDCMSPHLAPPSGDLAQALGRAFGGDARAEFIAQGLGHFGSGWVWLTAERGVLSIVTTHDGDTVLRHEGVTPLLVCDLWEHAYYLDYRNDRGAYLSGWWDGAANWAFAQRQYEASLGRAEGWAYPAVPVAATASA